MEDKKSCRPLALSDGSLALLDPCFKPGVAALTMKSVDLTDNAHVFCNQRDVLVGHRCGGLFMGFM